ncbi:nickel pincer cofactor biosynthesis protein LarC, partial [Coleofasciculus sp. LEGE 07081]
KLAYLDCQTGIAGDMCLGALVGAGVPLEYLIEKLKGLGIDEEYRLRAESVHRNGQLATKVHVDLLGEVEHDHHHSQGQNSHDHNLSGHAPTRHLPEIEGMLKMAGLPPRVLDWSLAVFRNLAEAEGAVHGIAPTQVHFHEVGATDALIDIVGTCLGLDWLGIDQLYCSALPTGGGIVRAAHGQLPVPVPAVLKLWESRQVPIYSNGIERELVTPTGAALAVTLAVSFGSPPPMSIQKVGQGAGTAQLPIPNILRLWIGEASEVQLPDSGQLNNDPCQETICVLETQIDDLSPQAIGYVFEVLFNAGALDVFTQAVGMKKSRLGILLTVICPPEKATVCEDILFRETTTLGIRHFIQQRTVLDREIQEVQTDYGTVRVKVASRTRSGKKAIANVQPEYDDCAAIARHHNLSWREVHQLALDTWYRQHG